jgi:NADH-quinone oxidoreductase subunit N
MADRIMLLVPELVLLLGAVICAVAGLAHNSAIRRRVGLVAAAFRAAAGICAVVLHDPQRGAAAGALMPSIALYVKLMTAGVGILLVLAAGGLVDRRYERAIDTGTDQYDPLRASNGEFHALALLSLAGLMLICEARDLIWLFLALELASLPSYVMVAISRWSRVGQEAAMKYFFLGALSSALMLYGFAPPRARWSWRTSQASCR